MWLLSLSGNSSAFHFVVVLFCASNCRSSALSLNHSSRQSRRSSFIYQQNEVGFFLFLFARPPPHFKMFYSLFSFSPLLHSLKLLYTSFTCAFVHFSLFLPCGSSAGVCMCTLCDTRHGGCCRQPFCSDVPPLIRGLFLLEMRKILSLSDTLEQGVGFAYYIEYFLWWFEYRM